MENKDQDYLHQGQQGSGSAENKGGSRDEQKNILASLSEEERQDIASQLGNDKNRIADIQELGGLSGRDDSAGGTNDGMAGQSTGSPTDR